MDKTIALKKSCFILSDRSDFHLINCLSIAFYTFPRCYIYIYIYVCVCVCVCVCG